MIDHESGECSTCKKTVIRLYGVEGLCSKCIDTVSSTIDVYICSGCKPEYNPGLGPVDFPVCCPDRFYELQPKEPVLTLRQRMAWDILLNASDAVVEGLQEAGADITEDNIYKGCFASADSFISYCESEGKVEKCDLCKEPIGDIKVSMLPDLTVCKKCSEKKFYV